MITNGSVLTESRTLMCMCIAQAVHPVMVNAGQTGDKQVSAVKHRP